MNIRMKLADMLGALLLAGMTVPGCQRQSTPPDAAPVNPSAVAPTVPSTRPGPSAAAPATATPTRETRFEGTVMLINRDRRQVTFRLDDGKTVRLNVGKGAGALTTIKKGDRAAFSLRETVEVVQDASFHPESGHLVDRAPPGSMAEREQYNTYFNRSPAGHHEVNWSEVIEIPARVVGLEPGSRLLKLKTYDGRLIEVRPDSGNGDIKDFAMLKIGEPVVARFRELDDIRVLETSAAGQVNPTPPTQP